MIMLFIIEGIMMIVNMPAKLLPSI